MTLSLSEVETESQSDALDRVVGLSSSSFSESSPETNFIPETPCGNTPPSKYGQEWAQVERDDYVNLGEDSILMAFFENIVD